MLISKEAIFLNENLTSQEEVFRFIAQKAVALGVSADENAVYNGLVEREQQGTTGRIRDSTCKIKCHHNSENRDCTT